MYVRDVIGPNKNASLQKYVAPNGKGGKRI